MSHGICLAGDRVEVQVAGRDVSGFPGEEALVEPLADLEPVGIIVPDEPVGGIQDRLCGPEILPQDRPPCSRIGGAEAQDIADGRAPKPVDALIVIPHHGEIAARAGQESHQLPLGGIRVLKLVHKDVAKAPAELLQDQRMLPEETQAEQDLIPEVHQPMLGQQALVGPVALRQLGLKGRLLLEGGIRGSGPGAFRQSGCKG